MPPQPNGSLHHEVTTVTEESQFAGLQQGIQGFQKNTFAFKPFELTEEPDTSYSDLLSERNTLQAELAKKEKKIKQLEKDLNESKGANDELEEAVTSLRTTNETLTRSSAKTKQTLQDLATKYNGVVTASTVLQTDFNTLLGHVMRILKLDSTKITTTSEIFRSLDNYTAAPGIPTPPATPNPAETEKIEKEKVELTLQLNATVLRYQKLVHDIKIYREDSEAAMEKLAAANKELERMRGLLDIINSNSSEARISLTSVSEKVDDVWKYRSKHAATVFAQYDEIIITSSSHLDAELPNGSDSPGDDSSSS